MENQSHKSHKRNTYTQVYCVFESYSRKHSSQVTELVDLVNVIQIET